MDRIRLSHEARCLTIVAGDVLERCIEDRARAIAVSRSAAVISEDDVTQATREFFNEGLAKLPDLISRATEDFKRRSCQAA